MKTKEPPARPRGRPYLPPGTAKRILIGFKASETEAKIITKASARAKKGKSDWMRSIILEAAAKAA